MTVEQAIESRHSVRAYNENAIPKDIRSQLDAEAASINQESGLHVFIRYDDPSGFDSRLAHYGRFRNVKNYIVLSGKPAEQFDYLCGYYGERLVLFAQRLGLNTCWAALTFDKKKVKALIPEGEKLCMVIALGYGQTQGVEHKSKPIGAVSEEGPEWFQAGVRAALKAPTAVNQQKFFFFLKDGKPCLRVKGFGSYTAVDLGIAAYHFETVTGRKAERA